MALFCASADPKTAAHFSGRWLCFAHRLIRKPLRTFRADASAQRPAAVDEEIGAGDERGGGRSEEDDGSHHINGLADAAKRDVAEGGGMIAGIAQIGSRAVGPDEGRPDTVYIDVVPGPFESK